MAPRLAHKKSRKGCRRCKARRVKCDETHPKCSNCAKHEVSCEYSNPIQQARFQSEDPQPQAESRSFAQSPISLSLPYSDPGDLETLFKPEERRVLELRLLHHFVTIVTYTFPACNEQRFRDLWNIDTILISFEHPFLFNAILAISSLHLLSEARSTAYFYAKDENQVAVQRVTKAPSTTDFSPDLASAHRAYLNLAIKQQREAISKLGTTTADAIFMASLLLSYQSINLIPDPSASSSYTPPIQWLKMTKAVYTVIEAAKPMLQNNSVIDLILSFSNEPDFKDREAMFNPLHREPFEALLDWIKYPEPDLDSEIKIVYEETLAYVGGVYRALLDKEAPRSMLRRVVCLGVLVPPRYVRLLEQRRPRALAILAHHFALSQVVEEHWWFHGVAHRVVNGIQSILPANWQWAMDWPLSMIRASSHDQLSHSNT